MELTFPHNLRIPLGLFRTSLPLEMIDAVDMWRTVKKEKTCGMG